MLAVFTSGNVRKITDLPVIFPQIAGESEASMLSTFVLIIAGCGHDSYDCTPVQMLEIEAASRAECETILDQEMAASRIEYPVLEGICVPEGGLARAPLWVAPAVAKAIRNDSRNL